MTADDNFMSQIENGEQWLRSACDDPPFSNVDRLKQNVRSAVEERWLADRLGDQSPNGLTERIKYRVRKSIDARPSAAPRGGAVRRAESGAARWMYWAAGMSAAAAVLAFVAWTPPSTQRPESTATDAFEAFDAEDEFSQALVLLENDLRALESNSADGSLAGVEESFDEIEDDREGRLRDDDEMDWS